MQTADTAGEIELAEVTRGAIVESRHRGRIVVLDRDAGGTPRVRCAAGDVSSPVYARSAIKPVQATAMVEAGFDGPSAALALAAASHGGEEIHLAGVRAVLAAAGLAESALRCPADLPLSAVAQADWLRAGRAPAPVCHNCSGKHAAMVATCVRNGWPVAEYLQPDHPLQQAIATAVVRFGGEPIGATSVDGCGAPAHAVSLTALATAFAALAGSPVDSPAGRVGAAMRAHPLLVGGTGRPVTELPPDADGLVCKDGAEGVWAAALPDGRAFAAKITDGNGRALGPLLAAVLATWGFDGPAVRRWAALPVLGGGLPVGELRPAEQLLSLLS
jgi:L-asparaginase II